MSSTDDSISGLISDIPSGDYHSSPGLSFTGFKHFMRSPAHYKHFLTSEKKQSHAQKLGSLLHLATLEPQCSRSDEHAPPT